MAYQPAGVTTQSSTLAHLATVHYKREALDTLRQMFRFANVCEPDEIPLRVGKTAQWYRYSVFGANTTPSSEGVVGTSLVPTTATISATVSEYSDFITTSSLLEETAIDPVVENCSRELGYRAGLTVDTLGRIEFDANSGQNVNMLGATTTVGDLRNVIAILKTNLVRPKDDGYFRGICHPYITYDLQSDNTAGGFIDMARWLKPEVMSEGANLGLVGRAAGVDIYESTNVGTSGTAPNVIYNFYIVGNRAVGMVDLAGRGPSKVTDPTKQSFAIATGKGGPALADPEGKIGSFVSYRFVMVFKTMDTTTLRFRSLQSDASLI